MTFDIDSAYDVLDCTYTNTKRGHIVIHNIANPTDTGTALRVHAEGRSVGAGPGLRARPRRRPADSGAILPGDEYNAAETVPTGWDLTERDLQRRSPLTNIDVNPGETVTCTFTNTAARRDHHRQGDGPAGYPHEFHFTLTGGPIGPQPVVQPRRRGPQEPAAFLPASATRRRRPPPLAGI